MEFPQVHTSNNYFTIMLTVLVLIGQEILLLTSAASSDHPSTSYTTQTGDNFKHDELFYLIAFDIVT